MSFFLCGRSAAPGATVVSATLAPSELQARGFLRRDPSVSQSLSQSASKQASSRQSHRAETARAGGAGKPGGHQPARRPDAPHAHAHAQTRRQEADSETHRQANRRRGTSTTTQPSAAPVGRHGLEADLSDDSERQMSFPTAKPSRRHIDGSGDDHRDGDHDGEGRRRPLHRDGKVC